MATMGLRPFTSEDIGAAEEIERGVYPQPWSAGIFADELSQDNRVYLVLDDDGDVAGYGGLMLVGDEAHITTVVVAPQRRQGRLGTRLMLGLVEAAIDHGARSLTLEVRSSNQAAQALYRRFGMAPVGVRKQYYRDEDALIMWVHDIESAEYAERLETIRGDLT
jgi:[ribosomal protein S18]-alanine N-acetyltransferase